MEGLGPGKPLGILAYLIVHGEARRDELISLFWGELPEQKARNAFRQTLHRLRKGLGKTLTAPNASTLAFQGDERFQPDVTAFEQALQRGHFSAALALYRGPFLQDLELGERDFDHWVLAERARLDTRYQWALEQVIAAANAAGSTDEALAKAKLLTRSAPLSASAALSEATLLIAVGRTSEARSHLEQFTERYQSEFGDDPPAGIRDSLSRLRKETSLSAGAAAVVPQRLVVGRESELARMLSVWTHTNSGNGNLILVEGPEGVGKTALVEEFLVRIATLGPVLRLSGRERSSGAMLPFASIAEALRGVLTAPGLAGASQHLLAEAARLLPELHDQFELPAVQEVADETSQVRFFEGIAALIDAVAYEQPVCLVLEDFHSTSPSTAALIEYLCVRLASVGVAIIPVFRAPAAGTPTQSLFPFSLLETSTTHREHKYPITVTRISVGPLKPEDAAVLARSVADEDVLPAEECERIAALAGGVPYRVLDLARQAAGGLRISAPPATLQDSLWARLQGCSPAQQRLFVAAALLDRPASIKLLAGASHLSESAAFDAVLALESRGLVRQTPRGVSPEHHDAAMLALKGTGPAGRALLAGWAAEALAADPSGTHLELAHLFHISGNNKECFKHAVAAVYEVAALREQTSVTHFLDLALRTASSPADRTKVDSMRRIFEPNPRLLSGEHEEFLDGAATTQEKEQQSPIKPGPLGVAEYARLLGVSLWRSGPVRIAGGIALGMTLALAGLSTAETRRRAKGPILPDTLFLINRSAQTPALFFIAGELKRGAGVPEVYVRHSQTGWVDSLALPFMNPVQSPTGNFVAVERMRDTGPDIFLFSPDGQIVREIASEAGDDIIAGWSPDGNWLLVTHGRSLADGNYDADLFAMSADGTRRLTIDASPYRSVVDAEWSPDGTHIAWTARVGSTHQQEVFISNADGTALVNVSNSPEEDFHIVWSRDGGRLAFTSNRFGNAEILAYELATQKLWRLTNDPGQDDYATFSPDGQFVAFESTAGGAASVFVVRSYGGNPARVTGGTQTFTIARWGQPSDGTSYISKVRIVVPDQVLLSQEVTARATASTLTNGELIPPAVRWMNLDPSLVDVRVGSRDSDENSNAFATLTGLRPGLARIAISAGGWRTDTTVLRVGNSHIDLVSEDFTGGLNPQKWLSLGDSAPVVQRTETGAELSAKSGRQRESGVLSAARLPLYAGFFARVAVRAPLHAPTAQRGFSISLIASDANGVTSTGRNQTRLATIEWIGQAARISYSVDRESWTEPVESLGVSDAHFFEILIDQEGKAVFRADGKQRWKSRLRIPAGVRGQLWLGTQGSADLITFDNVRAGLNPVENRQ